MQVQPLLALPKSIHPRYVLEGVWEGYIAKLLGRWILHRGQIVNSPLHQYPLCAIGVWVISEDVSLKKQTSYHSHKFATGFSDMEPQRGQSAPKIYSVAKDITKVVALVGHSRFSQGSWEYQFIPHFPGQHVSHQVI